MRARTNATPRAWLESAGLVSIGPMYPCRKVGLAFFDEAPFRFEASVEVEAPPERVFDIFEDARSWPAWVPLIKRVEWTSPKPFGVGTTRTVTMVGGLVADEEFIAWEPGKRMAFYFRATSQKNLVAFAEDYRVTDLGNGRSRIAWRVAMEVSGLNRLAMPLTGPLVGLGLKWMLGRLRRYARASSIPPA